MGQITVVGLGAGELSQLPVGIYRALKKAECLYVRTAEHPVLSELKEEGVMFTSFDHVYESQSRFEDVYETIVAQLLEKAQKENVLYAVPGHPYVAEKTVQLLQDRIQDTGIEMNVLGGASFLDQMYTALGIDPIEGCQVVDGTSLVSEELQIRHHLIVVQVYDSFIASDVKLTLMEKLPDDYEVMIVTAAGSSEEKIKRVPLFELDRYTEINNLTAVYVPPVQDEKLLYRDFSFVRKIIATLRGPEGCPWDREQTHESLKRFLLEEAYEVLEAIDEQDDQHLVDELGDVLLQVLLHAQIGEEEGFFSIDDVIAALTGKMIRRHPHVFGDVTVANEAEVSANWQQIKENEKQGETGQSILSDLAKSPSMLAAAELLQKQAAKTGFEYEVVEDVWNKLHEEMEEFKHEVQMENRDKMEKEFGDLLLAAVSVARFHKISPEIALHRSLRVFKNRFHFIERKAKNQGKPINECGLEQLNEWWNEAKRSETD